MQIIKNIKERTKLICDYLLINNSDLFDKDWYKKEYGEEEKAKKDPVLHYIQFGWKELRNPSPIFNTYDYLATNPDVLEKDCNPLIHYLRFGKKEMRNPKRNEIIKDEKLLGSNANFSNSLKILENWLVSVEQFYERLTEDIQRRNINPSDNCSLEDLSKTIIQKRDRISFNIYGEKYAEYLLPVLLKNLLDKYRLTIVIINTLDGIWLAIMANLFPNSRLIGIDEDLSLTKENLENLRKYCNFDNIQLELYEYDRFNRFLKNLNPADNNTNINICIDNYNHKNEDIINMTDLLLSHMANDFIFCTRNSNENYEINNLQYSNFKVELFGELVIISNNSIIQDNNINQNLNHELNDIEWTIKTFQKFLGYPLNIRNPKTFNEKINVYKLFYREKPLWMYADKFLVQQYIEKKIGSKYLIPLIGVYDHVEEINYSKLPSQFILKMNHGSGWNIICFDKNKLDWECCKKQVKDWESSNYYNIWREWAYKNIHPKILIQKLIFNSKGKIPLNYRFFCFSGKPLIVEVDHTIEDIDNFNNTSWQQLPFIQQYKSNPKIIIPKPDNLDEMLDIAAKISNGFPFVRIDLFAIPDIFFGEMTFYPGAGLSKFSPDYWDLKIGNYWC